MYLDDVLVEEVVYLGGDADADGPAAHQRLTFAPFKAQLEDLREHIAPVRAQLEHLRATSTGKFELHGGQNELKFAAK
jgi:hypothetical protein